MQPSLTALPTPSLRLVRALAPAVLALLLAGCQTTGTDSTPEDDEPPELRSEGPPPSLAELANATYGGIAEEPITLTNGEWEGEPFEPGAASRPRVVLGPGFRILVDLDDDGVQESAVVLGESAGGSGSNDHVVVVQRRDGALRQVGHALIGDRIQIRSGQATEGGLALDVVQHAETDPACCPTRKVRRSWRLGAAGLVETPPLDQGPVSLTDLEGVRWRLTHFGEEPLPERASVTLEFTPGRASGRTTCNRYFAAPEPGDRPGQVEFGRIGSTRMACPPEPTALEQQFLGDLERVTRFSFWLTRLLLQGDASPLLRFDPDRP